MNITPESKPISEIFSIEGKDIYRVPVYQRNYAWDPENIEELFNDVRNEGAGYYIGSLLVTRADKENGRTVYEIVDGQQRLTTISLFLIATYQYLRDIENTQENDIRSIIKTQEDIERKVRMDDGTTKLQLLERDQEIYEDYLKLFDDKELSKYGNRAFAKRYNFILELFNEEFENCDEAISFYEKLNEVEILRIIAEDINDAFTIFSSINAKGMPLTLIDLMKSTYLGEATKSGMSQSDALDQWNELVEIFEDENGNTNSTAITQFLLNNYDTFYSSTSSSLTKKKALKVYQQIFNKTDGHKEIKILVENAKLFSHISPLTEPDQSIELSEDISASLNSLKKLDSSQSYPLLLFMLKLLKKNEVEEMTVVEILRYIIKFFVRRNIVLKPKSSNIRAKMIEIVRTLSENKHTDYLSTVTEKLESISVSDEEFLNSLKEGVYDVSAQTVRYLLIDLERRYGRNFFNKQNVDSLDDYKTTKGNKRIPVWTLEHILPTTKSLKYGWPNMISPDNVEMSEMIQQYNVHKLGNLTLTGYNSEMSDKSFVEKRDYKVPGTNDNYTGLRTPLFINESIPKKGELIENKYTWTIEDIDRRTAVLAELIVKDYKL